MREVAGKTFFSEEKKQKTFTPAVAPKAIEGGGEEPPSCNDDNPNLPQRPEAKIFWSFFPKKDDLPFPYPTPRTTAISRSLIFLRSVFRFSPSISAALIWLPRVCRQRHADQRPLHLSDHLVIDVPRGDAVRAARQHAAYVLFHRLPQIACTAGLLPILVLRPLGQLGVHDVGGDRLLRRQCRQAAHQVFQLAHVARPAVTAQRVYGRPLVELSSAASPACARSVNAKCRASAGMSAVRSRKRRAGGSAQR